MKHYSKQEIDQTRAYFITQGFPFRSEQIGGLSIDFFVLPASLNPDLPKFAFVCAGNPEDGHVIGVCETLKEFAPYVAYHEYLEYVVLADTPGRCVTALKRELAEVPEGIREEYIATRRNFFNRLVRYAQDIGMPDSEIAEFEQSRSYIELL